MIKCIYKNNGGDFVYKKTAVHYASKFMVDIMFYGGIVTVATVPWWTKFFRDYFGYTTAEWYYIMVTLFISGICAVYIFYNLKQMFKTLLGGNPFVEENVSAFRKIAAACLIIAAIYAVKTFAMFSLATPLIVLVFVIGSLFCLTLKDIFKQAVYYKEENDGTI